MVAKEDLRKILEDLKRSGRLKSFAIVSLDGVILESSNPDEFSQGTLTAKGASIFHGVEMVLSDMMDGSVDRTIAESGKYRLIVTRSGSVALLVAVTDISENLLEILKILENASMRIKEVLG